jgi:hypothetical protein
MELQTLSKLGALKRREFFDNLLKNVNEDHLRFLQRQKERIERQVFFFSTPFSVSRYIYVKIELCLSNCCFSVIRIHRVDVELPGIEVRYNNLFVEAESRNTNGNHLPSLWNSTKAIFSVRQPGHDWFYCGPK